MVNKTKRIIWTNILSLEDLEDYFAEEGITDETEKYERLCDYCHITYNDELQNLDMELPNNILVIADLGLWYGRRSGYKELGNNLNEILKVAVGDYFEVYFDGYNVRARDSHHDGTNYYLFRLIKPERNIEILKDKIYAGDFSREDINNYTKSLAPFVRQIYGW